MKRYRIKKTKDWGYVVQWRYWWMPFYFNHYGHNATVVDAKQRILILEKKDLELYGVVWKGTNEDLK